MRRLAVLTAVLFGSALAALACNKTKTVAVEGDDDDDAGTHVDAGSGAETGDDDDDAGQPVDLGDAGFAVPECTGAVLSSLTNIIRLRVHPNGSLFALAASGVLHKFTVSGDASTDCTLTPVATFLPDQGLHDFDIDSAGELFTIRAPSLNSAAVEKRDPATGATTGVTCNLGGDSNAYWGRLAITPDGTKGAVVSTGTSGAQSGSGVYAYTLALGATCTSTAWAPNVGTTCGAAGILGQGLRATANDVFIVCSQVVALPFGSTTPSFTTSGTTPGHIEDLALTQASLDAPDSTNKDVIRFDSVGAYQKSVSVRDLIGNSISGNSNTANLYRIHAMSDPLNGVRYIAVTSDGVNAYHLFRITDF